MISFVVPAHNEQAYVGRTVDAIREAARGIDGEYEIVVVDNASTDSTATIAAQRGARVLTVNHRQIAATRNAGARAAQGDRLFFVDADTTIDARVVKSALGAMDRGAAGGGAPARFDGNVPLYAPLLLWWCNLFMRIAGITGGACMFCTRRAFEAAGGFDENLYGAEDAKFAWAIKQTGPFVVLWRHVVTSGRRARGMSGLRMVTLLFQMALFPAMLRRRETVGKVWYDSNRVDDDAPRQGIAIWLSNTVLLVIMLVMLAGPLLNFLPWSLTPRGSVLGYVRYAIAIFGCHVGIMLFPCAYFLVRILVRQKRWSERLKLVVLIALCLFFGWSAAREVFWFWADII